MSIPVLGLLSVVVLAVSLWALWHHHKLLRLRGLVDDRLAKLENHLHNYLEDIYDQADDENGYDIREQCIELSGKETRQIIKALPKLHKAVGITAEEAEKIQQAAGGYNDALTEYNSYVSKPPGLIMSTLVGLRLEKPINVSHASSAEALSEVVEPPNPPV